MNINSNYGMAIGNLTSQAASNLNLNDLLARTNSQIGTLKKYNCRRLILNYAEILKEKVPNLIFFDNEQFKFKHIIHN